VGGRKIGLERVKTPENTKEDSDDSEPADEGDTQIEYPFDELYRPSIGAVTKNYLLRHQVTIGTLCYSLIC